jgi:hypothetical protein
MEPPSPSDRAQPVAGSSPPRKPYRTPRLTEYGSIAKLTRSGGTTMAESGNPMMMMSVCL